MDIDDLIRRLKFGMASTDGELCSLISEAADTIDALRERVKVLEGALDDCVGYIRADVVNLATAHGVADWKAVAPYAATIIDRAEKARAALKDADT